MSTKIFYFFCQSCGGDTASFEYEAVCRYCRAGRDKFQLVGESVMSSQKADIQQKLEMIRARWMTEHGITSAGRPLKRGLFKRG